ncbi:MAG: CRISPR-associated protein Csx19 [Bacteroidota bacterium]
MRPPSPVRDAISALYAPTPLREVVTTTSEPVRFAVGAGDSDQALRNALCKLAAEAEAHWLLAHLDDGVAWGRFEPDGSGGVSLALARELADDVERAKRYSAPLRAATLLRARVFGEDVEVRVRRSRDRFRAHRLRDKVGDGDGAFEGALDLVHEVWGQWGRPLGGSFTYVDEGQKGFGHVLPLAPPPGFAADPEAEFGPVRAGYRVRTYLGLSSAPGDTPTSGGAGLVPVAHRLVALGWILNDTDAPDSDA